MRLSGVDDDGVRVGRSQLKVLSADLQHVLHGGMQGLVVDHLERKQDVLRGNRMAVGKCRAFAKMERPRHAVRRHLPRFRQAGFVLLRRQVVVDQKAEQAIR